MSTTQVDDRVVTTRHVDEARARVADLFCPHGLEPHGDVDLHLTARRTPRVGIVEMDYGATVDITPEPLESFYLVQIPRRGTARVRHEDSEISSGPGLASVLSPRSATDMTWYAGNPQVLVYLERSLVEECAAALSGTEPRGPLVFDLGMPLSSPDARSWLATVGCLRAELAGARPGAAAVHASELGHAVANQLVESQHHTHSALIAQRGGAPRGTARRAARYVEQRLAQPLTVSSVAAAQGVCTRVLQEAFRRELDTTPLGFIHDLRMRTARARLLAADPGEVSVTDVALGVGMTHLGRFSVAYRDRYGESPSTTLRRSTTGPPPSDHPPEGAPCPH